MPNKLNLNSFQSFIKLESFAGVLLSITTIIALLWANSMFSANYFNFQNVEFGFTVGSFSLIKPLYLWVNDGLMAIFFFVIGLEIKRELLIGELNTMRSATLPVLGAIGGIVVPILFFLAFNKEQATANGWGIPIATDIAFSLAIIKTLGKKVPLSLKLFLTAFAIVDDIGAVLIIAIFYSSAIYWYYVFIALTLLAVLFILSYKGIFSRTIILVFGAIIWLLFLKSGLHPTIAGILVALSVPIRQKVDLKLYTKKLKEISNNIFAANKEDELLLSDKQINEINKLEDWTLRVQSPLQQLEHQLHGFVAFFIIPVFALINAGVTFESSGNLNIQLIIGLVVSLVFGKSIGISLFAFIGIKSGLTELPKDATWQDVIGIAFIAGVGFTMSIFIAGLAFLNKPELISSSKIGIIIGSAIAAIIGVILLQLKKKK